MLLCTSFFTSFNSLLVVANEKVKLDIYYQQEQRDSRAWLAARLLAVIADYAGSFSFLMVKYEWMREGIPLMILSSYEKMLS